MNSVSLTFLAIAVLAFQSVNAQNYNVYRRMFDGSRRPAVFISSGRGVRTQSSLEPHTPLESQLRVRQAGEKIRLDVYYETNCPDSMRFITMQLYPLYQEMEDALDIHLIPYGKAHESFNAEKKRYDFSCHHGPSECYGNTVQSCAISLYPKTKDHLNFINCMESYPRPSHSGRKCARRLSLDWDKIEKCVKGEEGNRLLHEDARKTTSLDPKLYFVPWIVVDKVFSEGNQRIALRNLKGLVCNKYKVNHPACNK